MSKAIEVRSQAVTALLTQLKDKTGNVSPVLKALGEDIAERTKERFGTGAAPDGTPWQANSHVTLMRYLQAKGGLSKKTGKVSAKGKLAAAGKKPLIGISHDLSRQISWDVVGETLTVGSTMKYARIQQQGGAKAQFSNLWGDIPARPFLPITPAGTLYPQEESRIVETLREYLAV